MLKTNKSITITGQSFVETTTENGQKAQKQVACMNANIHENGEINVNKSILDKNLFKENRESVYADFEQFENMVYKL